MNQSQRSCVPLKVRSVVDKGFDGDGAKNQTKGITS